MRGLAALVSFADAGLHSLSATALALGLHVRTSISEWSITHCFDYLTYNKHVLGKHGIGSI